MATSSSNSHPTDSSPLDEGGATKNTKGNWNMFCQPSDSNSTQTFAYHVSSGIGDANINPNIGQTNAMEYGATLREQLWIMRMINLVCCGLAILLETSLIIWRILNPTKLVLGVYLTFFALLVCCYELHTPIVSKVIRDNFGFFYNPILRSVFILFMGGLCFGQGGIIEFILGLSFVVNASFTLFVFATNAEYRRRNNNYDEEQEKQDDLLNIVKDQSIERGWVNPDTIMNIATNSTTGEREPLVS